MINRSKVPEIAVDQDENEARHCQEMKETLKAKDFVVTQVTKRNQVIRRATEDEVGDFKCQGCGPEVVEVRWY